MAGVVYLTCDWAESHTLAAQTWLWGSMGVKVKINVTFPACPVSEVSLCLSPEGSLLSDLKRDTGIEGHHSLILSSNKTFILHGAPVSVMGRA